MGRDFLRDTQVEISSLKDVIETYENSTFPLRKAKVVGISLNTLGFDPEEAKKEILALEEKLNLPVCDPILQNSDKLLKAIIEK